MKKVLIICFLLALLGFGCKKDYTCTCKIMCPSGAPYPGMSITKITIDDTPKNAKKTCSSYNNGSGACASTGCSLN
jgi:hypothetical protein